MPTRIEVERSGGRHVVRLGHGLLRAQLVSSDADRCRIGLLATTALLLGGDVVELEIGVGPGACLELFDVAGTVAYHGRGRPSGWVVRVALEEGARLDYAGEPFVVADGADVSRTLELELADGASARLRDTVVLGRARERGGRLRSRTAVVAGGGPVLLEDQQLDPDRLRGAPGMLADHRVLDTILEVGPAAPGVPAGAAAYGLVDGAGRVARWLGRSLADSPLHAFDRGAGRRPVAPEVVG